MEEFTNQQILDAAQHGFVRVLVESEGDNDALLEFMRDNGFKWLSGDSLLKTSYYKPGWLIVYDFQKESTGCCHTTFARFSVEKEFLAWISESPRKKCVRYKPQEVTFSFDDLFSKN